MIRSAADTLGTDNLVATYDALARATEGAVALPLGSYPGYIGTVDHPICNYVVVQNISSWDMKLILEAARARKAFYVYLLDSHPSSEELLERANFKKYYELVQMEAHARPTTETLPLGACKSMGERLQVAQFMIDQFFNRQGKQFKEAISHATAFAQPLDLFKLKLKEEVIAGAMLCRTSNALGIYNLCVASRFQGRGYGKRMVSWALDLASAEKRVPVLQCEPRLSDWYAGQGFARTGTVKIFGLDHSAII